jgi:tetratricopeptide (TPR) repeat protein
VLLTFSLACNSSKSNEKAASAPASPEQREGAQSEPQKQPAAEVPAAPKPAEKQQQKSISYAKNPERFVKMQPAEPVFNITDPKTGQEHFNVGVNDDHHDQFDKAIAEYQKALELQPNWALAHFRMAQDYQKLGRTDDAIVQWEQTTRCDPHFYLAYDLLSAAYARQGNLKKAIEAYSPMLNYAPAQMPAHYQLGIWYAELGDTAHAREHLEAYREIAIKSKSIETKSDRFQKATQELAKLKQ